mgnify:CR=1 FL=1
MSKITKKKPRKKSLKTLRKTAWTACSQFVRQFYSDHRGHARCYTCGVVDDWKSLQAGHAIPGRSNAVLLDTDIIRVQCYVCNIHKRGAHHLFSTNLIKEHGLEWWENKLQQARQIVKFTREDYEKFAEEFNLKIQQLSIDRRTAKWKGG